MVVLVICIFVIVVVVASYNKVQENKRLTEEGKVVQRKSAFWKEGHYFYTNTTYEDLLEAVKNADFSDCRASITFNADGMQCIRFESSYKWIAELSGLESDEEQHLYYFSFEKWESSNGMPKGWEYMNVALTTIEKIFLSLDSETTVESVKEKIKTKTSFF